MIRTDLADFLENKLCFDMKDFYDELSLPNNIHNKQILESLIEKAIYLNRQNYGLHDFMEVNDKLIELCAYDNDFLYDFCGNLSMYVCNGIASLIKHNETLDNWYPKIIVTDVIECETNTTNMLANEVTIYRGCNKEEFDNKKFGQSWSIDKEQAKYFAFNFYHQQEGFDINNRIVVKANVKKEDIFYTFPENDSEREVIPNTSKLFNLEKIE